MDTRTKRQKLEAMAAQTASPREAEIAKDILADMPAPRTLSRDEILATPDLRAGVGSTRVYDPSLRVYVVLDDDDPSFSSSFDVTDEDLADLRDEASERLASVYGVSRAIKVG